MSWDVLTAPFVPQDPFGRSLRTLPRAGPGLLLASRGQDAILPRSWNASSPRALPPGCPWSGFTPPNVDWCEEELCAWVVNPADTWSNLAYRRRRRAWMWWAARQRRRAWASRCSVLPPLVGGCVLGHLPRLLHLCPPAARLSGHVRLLLPRDHPERAAAGLDRRGVSPALVSGWCRALQRPDSAALRDGAFPSRDWCSR